MALTEKPISIRLDTEAFDYMEEVLENLKVSRNNFINQAVMEKLEDIYDVSIADQSYARWVENGKVTYSHEEAMRRYGSEEELEKEKLFKQLQKEVEKSVLDFETGEYYTDKDLEELYG